MNYKLTLVLLFPFLVMACSKESTKETTKTSPPAETQVAQEATNTAPSQLIYLEIKPETKPCTGVAPQTCLVVRELSIDQSGQKTYIDKEESYFYDNINNFKHDPNSTQIIKVKRTEIANPAADQSKYQYELDSVVETKPKA